MRRTMEVLGVIGMGLGLIAASLEVFVHFESATQLSIPNSQTNMESINCRPVLSAPSRHVPNFHRTHAKDNHHEEVEDAVYETATAKPDVPSGGRPIFSQF